MKIISTMIKQSILFLLFLSILSVQAQTGISVGPPRVYFIADAGQIRTERITVSNPSKDYTMDLGITFEDWKYSETGENILFPKNTLPTSCADWLTTSTSTFSLKPLEVKDILVNIQLPSNREQLDSIPVRTAMLYVTQLNPREGVDKNGANIRIAIRSGIKIYQTLPKDHLPDIELTNLEYMGKENNRLTLSYENIGNLWLEGKIAVELLNQDTGKKTKLEVIPFYSMPNDLRKQEIHLPADLVKGEYMATVVVSFGERNTVKVAELEFSHE